jgi:hypothetical protein
MSTKLNISHIFSVDQRYERDVKFNAYILQNSLNGHNEILNIQKMRPLVGRG